VQSWVSIALLTVILAACAAPAPAPAIYTCPSFPTRCEDYERGVISSDPIEPFEPTCPALGEFHDQFDFQLCRCDFEQQQLFERAECISERRAQMAADIYNEMVRVYNCRLSEEGCAPASGIRSVSLSSIFHPYMDRRPDLPSYTTFLTGHRFYDEFEAQSCRFEVEELRNDLTRWAERMAREAQSDAQFAADRAIERFNCHARGGQ
jgi:hypothetical protein